MTWLIFAVVSAFANSLRDIYIKKTCDESSHIIVACTRIIAFFYLLLLFPFYQSDLRIDTGHSTIFMIGLAITVVLTTIATVLKIGVIQKESISVCSPLMTLTPIFIIPWSLLLLKESPSPLAMIGIILSIAGAFGVMKAEGFKKTEQKTPVTKTIIYILIILLIYGLTTVIDKIEIRYSSAYTYTLIWTGCSAIAGLYSIKIAGLRAFRQFLLSRKNFLQAFLWTVGFFMQQLAVFYSMEISLNTAYIKSLSYVGMIFTILFGGRLFREKNIWKKLFAALIIILGNVIIIFGL